VTGRKKVTPAQETIQFSSHLEAESQNCWIVAGARGVADDFEVSAL